MTTLNDIDEAIELLREYGDDLNNFRFDVNVRGEDRSVELSDAHSTYHIQHTRVISLMSAYIKETK
jgi:hypothetical protein